MEEKSLLHQEALDTMTHVDKNHFVHFFNHEDEIVLEFLGDFNFFNPIECTEVEIDECTNLCDADIGTEVVNVAILLESIEKDCTLIDGVDMVLEVIQEEDEEMLPIFQVDVASGEEDDIILPSLEASKSTISSI